MIENFYHSIPYLYSVEIIFIIKTLIEISSERSVYEKPEEQDRQLMKYHCRIYFAYFLNQLKGVKNCLNSTNHQLLPVFYHLLNLISPFRLQSRKLSKYFISLESLILS